jgi:hypothetical protein
MRGQRHAPAALYPPEIPGTHCAGGWVGPRAGLDRCGEFHLPPGFDPRTVQPVASRHTDYATRPTETTKLIRKDLVLDDVKNKCFVADLRIAPRCKLDSRSFGISHSVEW